MQVWGLRVYCEIEGPEGYVRVSLRVPECKLLEAHNSIVKALNPKP